MSSGERGVCRITQFPISQLCLPRWITWPLWTSWTKYLLLCIIIKLATQGQQKASKTGMSGRCYWLKIQGALCLYSYLLLKWLPQFKIIRPLGINVFSLCILINFLLSLIEWELCMSFGDLMYSRIWIVILGNKWLLYLATCLATVVLEVCFMSKTWPWNLSVILISSLSHM